MSAGRSRESGGDEIGIKTDLVDLLERQQLSLRHLVRRLGVLRSTKDVHEPTSACEESDAECAVAKRTYRLCDPRLVDNLRDEISPLTRPRVSPELSTIKEELLLLVLAQLDDRSEATEKMDTERQMWRVEARRDEQHRERAARGRGSDSAEYGRKE